MTVRFAESVAFDAVAKETSAAEKPDPTAVFVRLLEQQVDHLADLLEFAGRDLDDASHMIFRPDHEKLSRQSVQLRRLMISTASNCDVSQPGDRLARNYSPAYHCMDLTESPTQGGGRNRRI